MKIQTTRYASDDIARRIVMYSYVSALNVAEGQDRDVS